MSDLTLAQWQHKAAHLTLPSQAFINGSYRDAVNGATFDCINPATGKLLTRVAACDAADAELAVQAARDAFNDKRWSGLPPKQRKQIMQRFAELMRLNKVELALLESLDMGKPIGDAMGYDAPAAANCIAWNAEAIDKIYDQVAPVEESALALVTREALGVVAAIVPWNFPLVMACWKLGPALATGNSVILKPSEKSPLTALRIAGLAKEAGIPDGVFNVLPGFGHTVGEALAHAHGCGLHHLHRFDQDRQASGAVLRQVQPQARLYGVWRQEPQHHTGGCTGSGRCGQERRWRYLLQSGRGVHRRLPPGWYKTASNRNLWERLLAHAREWISANPLDPATRIGAMVDHIQMEQVLRYIEIGKQEGAKLLLGGNRTNIESGGFYIETHHL